MRFAARRVVAAGEFVKAVQILADKNVEFVIIGGWAAIVHGSSYITNDLDVCFERSRENCSRLASALAPYHPRLRDLPPEFPFVWDASTLSNSTIFTHDRLGSH